MSNRLILGRCEDVLQEFPDNYFDSIVTDPPYGLEFMNKHWDYDVPSVYQWQQVLRVLKPGGHMLAFGGTRTYHRVVINIEDAGFEIRDQLQWIYASGFPKSVNINKNAEGHICNCSQRDSSVLKHYVRSVQQSDIPQEKRTQQEQPKVLFGDMPERGVSNKEGDNSTSGEQEGGGQPRMEGWSNDVQEEGELQERNVRSLPSGIYDDGTEGRIHNAAQVDNGANVQNDSVAEGSSASHRPQSKQQRVKQSRIVADEQRSQEMGAWKICTGCGKPILPAGMGTALKPAYEPICLARKPLDGTIVQNVLKYGTAGLNIDESRIPFVSNADKESATFGTGADIRGGNWAGGGHVASDKKNIEANDKGRFPANVILDEEAAAMLDEQSGVLTTSPMNSIAKGGQGDIYGKQYERPTFFPGDSGGASRFFYVAKADQEERHGGLHNMEARQRDTGRKKGDVGGDNPRNRGSLDKKNFHPTVKPVELMQYLVKLITPPDGIVCDPFCGSGSTLIAAGKLGFSYVGIEKEADYIEISRNRLKHVMGLFYTE